MRNLKCYAGNNKSSSRAQRTSPGTGQYGNLSPLRDVKAHLRGLNGTQDYFRVLFTSLLTLCVGILSAGNTAGGEAFGWRQPAVRQSRKKCRR